MATWSDDPTLTHGAQGRARLSGLRLWFTVFRHQSLWALRASLLSRRALLLAAGLALLLVMQFLVLSRRQAPDQVNRFFAGFQSWAGLSVLIPLSSMFLGVSALLDDIEGGSMAYFLSRPAPRSAIFLGRFAGAGMAALFFGFFLVGSSFGLVLVAGSFWPALRFLDPGQLPAFLAAAGAAALCFAALGAFLGAFTRRGLLCGLILVLGGELLAGALAARHQVAGLRSILATDLSRQLAQSLLPGELVERLGRVLPPLAAQATPALLLLDLGRYLGLCLGGGLLFFLLKEQPYRSRES